MNGKRIIWSFLLALSSAALVFSASAGWSLVNPSLTGTPLFDCCFISPTEGWVCGSNGKIFHTMDSGKTWELQMSPLNYGYPLRSLCFINADTGFAVGGNIGQCFALMTADGGKIWMDASQNFPFQMQKIISKTPGELWVICSRSTKQLAYSLDLGTTWKETDIGAPVLLNDITFIDSMTGFVCGNKGYVGRTIDGGRTWNKMNIDSLEEYESIRFLNNQIGYCVSAYADIYKTDNGGTDWRLTGRFGGQYYFNDLFFLNPDTGMVIGASDLFAVFKTFDGGTNWQHIVFPLNHPQTITRMVFPSKGRGIAISTHGSIYRVTGFSDSIQEVTSGTGDDVISVNVFDSSFIVCGRKDGSVLITHDGGFTWKEHLVKKGVCIGNILFLDQENLIARYQMNPLDVISMGACFRSTDGGVTWDTASDISVNNRYIKSLDKRATFAVNNWNLVRSLDGGKSWETRSDVKFILNIDTLWIKSNGLQGIYFLDKDNGWLISSHGYVTKTMDGGLTWSMSGIAPEGTFVYDFFFSNPDTGWIAGMSTDNPVILLTSDGGKTWGKQATLNINPEQKIKWESYNVIYPSIIKITGYSSRDLWALSDFAGVFHSTDAGNTWNEEILPQDGRTYQDMAVLNNGNIIVSGENSQIWRYEHNLTSCTTPNRAKIIRTGLKIRKAANHILKISVPRFNGNYSVSIFNCKGRVVQEISSSYCGFDGISIDIKDLKAGYYVFKMVTPTETYHANYLVVQ